jgi:hypothetical protein
LFNLYLVDLDFTPIGRGEQSSLFVLALVLSVIGLQALLYPFLPIMEQEHIGPNGISFGFPSPSQVDHGQGKGRMIDTEQHVAGTPFNVCPATISARSSASRAAPSATAFQGVSHSTLLESSIVPLLSHI